MTSKKKPAAINPFRQSVSPIWLTVYSDLVTNLTLFFLMVYAFTRLGVEQRNEIVAGLSQSFTRTGGVELRAKEVIKDFQQQQATEKIEELSRAGGQFSKYAQLEMNERLIKITLKAPVLFDSGSAGLKLQANEILDEITPLLRLLPQRIIVEGHTDNVPIAGGKYSSNWELSAARAFSVVDYFVRTKGIRPERFVIAGYGEFRPIAPNDTEENRAKNRRIEISILRTGEQ